MIPAALPHALRTINDLPEPEKYAIYRQLIPDFMLERYEIDPLTLTYQGRSVVTLRCPAGTRALEIAIRRRAGDHDPMLYLNMADTFNGQLLVLLVVVNDPDAPRFTIDRDEDGNPTHLGTASRNLPAEEAAMRAGLAPGQVRQGLRIFRPLIPIFEDFVLRMGHDIFFIEPLSYHNAIAFERYGFYYVRGQQEMMEIDRASQPGGDLHRRLHTSAPSVFRPADAWQTVRGRAWAIHDGLLGHPFTGFQMYKRIGHHAGIRTSGDLAW